ncbi:hypothetical protein G9A89_005593 [Geosiphon pyriformis]|nr:hypothetical protein G9A89_005593 [Geosiphon pyriformis]
MCNVRGLNNPVKQDDVIHWHKNMNNLKVHLWLTDKFNGVWVFTSGLDSGSLGASVLIVVNSSLAKHICKVSEVSGWLLSIKLLFKNKLSVSILGLYAGASLVVQFSQTGKINSFIAKAINESSFVVFGNDFNENGSQKCVSFKKCFELGLVNSLIGSLAIKMSIWANSKSVMKTIDYMFVSPNLVNSLVHRGVSNIDEYFDTDHQAVSVSIGLGGLLDTYLFSLRKQANKDHWKFDVKNTSEAKWLKFKDATAANTTMFSGAFGDAIMIFLASGTFKKRWFKGFDTVCNKVSFRFHKLELLVSKLVKTFHLSSSISFASLLGTWDNFNSAGASTVRSMFISGAKFDDICFALAKARRLYHSSKLLESKHAEESRIRQAITNRMESFELDKGCTIRSVLECLFRKVVLDHLVVGNELVLESDLVKSKTRKHMVVDDISDTWSHQYQPLDYIFDNAFSEVMGEIDFDELHHVITSLLDGKAAGLSGISNKLWKCCDKLVLGLLLVLLNSCLFCELVLGPWKETWVSIIPKPYEWKGVLMNTCPIALIKTARKILSKILSDRISLACSLYDVLCGDNFSVLKGTTTQFPIFVVGSVIENALEKNWELWLVLQDMWKVYDLVGWEHLERSLVRIKMCNFGLTNSYWVFDGLDQGKVFFSLLWHIFYDLLLCEVKCQESVCGYRLNSHFVFGSGRTKFQAGLSTFFAAGVFVDDSIWVGSINNISINNDKTVAIPINSRVSVPSLFISSLLIFVAHRGESHWYLGIFLSTEGLSRPSLAKAHSDVCFFTNLVLRKAVSDKQFLYLVSAVFHLIIGYRMQFGYIPVGVCLKLKAGLPMDFPSDTIHHPFFYGLKSFSQCQSESKVASLISFANSDRTLGHLFSHRSHDLQHFGVAFVDQLRDCHGVGFNWLDPCGSVPEWFKLSVLFLMASHLSSTASVGNGPLNFCESDDFVTARGRLSQVDINSLSVYTNSSLKYLGIGLVSSTLAELQAIVLALECIPAACSVNLFSNSQAALDTCRSELSLHRHIRNVIHSKNLRVSWHKVKGHSSILGNNCANSITDATSLSGWYLPPHMDRHFLLADGSVVSGNSRHFVRNVYRAVCHARWKIGSGSGFLASGLCSNVDWLSFSRVWHPDLHMATGFASRLTADTHTYLMKALYCQLPVAVWKHIYNKCYPSVLCLYCGKVKISDYVFSCVVDDLAHHQSLSGLSLLFLVVLQFMLTCALDLLVFSALYKGFVFNEWLQEAVTVFHDSKIVGVKITDFMCSLCSTFRNDIWLVHTKHRVFIEKNSLILVDGSIPIPVFGLVLRLLPSVVKLLGVTEAFGILFSFHKSCLFFSGIGDIVFVNIVA